MAIRDAAVVDGTGRFEQLVAQEAAPAGDEMDELGQAAWFVGRGGDGEVAHERGIATRVPGLAFVGLPFQYSVAA